MRYTNTSTQTHVEDEAGGGPGGQGQYLLLEQKIASAGLRQETLCPTLIGDSALWAQLGWVDYAEIVPCKAQVNT